jgi:hypothetical protein
MKKLLFPCILLSIFLLSGCTKQFEQSPISTEPEPMIQPTDSISSPTPLEEGHLIIEVAPQKQECQGEGTMQCFLVKRDGEDWQPWYGDIIGFEFEPGFFYTLEIAAVDVPDPLADGLSIEYHFVRVLEKRPE